MPSNQHKPFNYSPDSAAFDYLMTNRHIILFHRFSTDDSKNIICNHAQFQNESITMPFVSAVGWTWQALKRLILPDRISPFLIWGWERLSVLILAAFLIRSDFSIAWPTMHNPLGVISRSSLNTTSIFRIAFFTFQVLFSQLFFFFYYTIFLWLLKVAGFQVCGLRYV